VNTIPRHRGSRDLSQLLLDLILWRLFLPLLAVWLMAIAGVGFFCIKILENQQQRTVQSMAQMVDSHLEQGGRILDAISRVAEVLPEKDIDVFMDSTWKAYKHFETIYYLDRNNRIKLLVPFDRNYVGLDMSRLSDIQQGVEKNRIVISRPFISLRTGEPTVYLIRQLSPGGRVVGELNLGAFQDEIVRLSGLSGKDSVSILDQSGTLLAHPDVKLVKQQTHPAALKVLLHTPDGATVVHKLAETMVLGSVAKVDRVGWIVVDQIPISILLGPYALTLGITLIVSLGIWLALMWNLRKKLDQNVVAPLVQLSQGTDAIAVGDFSQVDSLALIPAAFNEIDTLADDFRHMSKVLQANQAALLDAQEELVRKEKLAILGQLSGSVGHELRNPLGVMNNAVYLLKMVLVEADETVKEYLGIIEKEIANSRRIINDLLDFARNKIPQTITVTVGALIDESLGRCAIPDNVALQTEIPDALPLLRVDPLQMGQVLTNLITNAVQAMPKGGSMRIGARKEPGTRSGERDGEAKELASPTSDLEPSGDFIEISVTDTGEGISPENMKKLFQPLFTTKAKGIGLGLVVCRNLVEANGGRIEVESEVGKGTRFAVLLPVRRGDGS